MYCLTTWFKDSSRDAETKIRRLLVGLSFHCDQLNNSQDLTGRYKHFTLPSIKIDPENHTFSVENNLPTFSNSLFGLFRKVCLNLGEGKSGRTWLTGATVQKDECQWPTSQKTRVDRRPLSQTNILPYCKHLTINIITNYFELLTYNIYIWFFPSHKPMTPEKAQQARHHPVAGEPLASLLSRGCHQPGGEHPVGFPGLLRAKGLHELSRGGSHDACAYWEWDMMGYDMWHDYTNCGLKPRIRTVIWPLQYWNPDTPTHGGQEHK